MSNPNSSDQSAEHAPQGSLRDLVERARDQYGVIDYTKAREAISLVQEDIRRFAEQHVLDERNLLFCGINEAGLKDASDENEGALFMGDYFSLSNPMDLASSPEVQDEHWVVNPVNYALQGGTLVIYNRRAIEGDEALEKPELMDEEFGTLMVVGSLERAQQHELGRIQLY